MLHDNEHLSDQIKIELSQKQQQRVNLIGGFSPIFHQQTANNTVGLKSFDIKSAAHPIPCIFTFIFKVIGLITYISIDVRYLIGGWFFSNVVLFVIVTFLAAIDFWTVKNITGRLLVKLRWWTDTDSNGQQKMKFESYDTKFKSDPVDKAFFWSSQIIFFLIWSALLLIKILSFGFLSFEGMLWVLLLCINIFVCGSNLYAYYLCRKDYGEKIKKTIKQGLAQQIIKNL